ncbi:E3 ubiquitin-protein ligase ZNF598 [Marchantia polymorpha subsp. ruderalis]|uniref:RING-type E3 ubiquitin transferase n=2 Tax=Marchantia polymorpha TaxID=3197 RepID=A0AAF6BKW9_MARPO|nr:hypothetical protein MARPO_0106s0017 [Marchantia polymorpha]PTQ31817.1 hypothetical protein MARPO_0106s0017 [Marchantia polymorpha]BBN12653.1 hypothetical protein Mp_5g21820 [Marchantia polymorpha subsp. ruderalis]BBN12654.1 hypothetical protein Mp_5g21820 [Marchantia polymorpha subsp. ruderalis]|eukprot:PTQ31816.1 hypothetical protein MARPO_0106s0017 [Marchantia polymorpha]
MEDCCAVCAEPLEWVGYGPCGHREVCFTCIARLRFVLNDKRCCICKQDCPQVYVTKALGDYTRVVTDWKVLPSRLGSSTAEGGDLWYDNVVEAYFDDEEPYKTIKAMCRLFCSVCENASPEDSGGKGMMKKGYIFKNIETLRRHQYTAHRVYMCELCLEGRKVFMIEQKLYSKSQLDRHNYKGDSEVDGTEEERGGFAGHPECAFCKKRFYGDNELYQHMSQEHYTCHICQRARPGHYEYYRNYDDLEAHFRQEHVLCEHPECLAKKFVVFPSEAELKRHNATTHGGHMSRSQRNAALQIPVSFHYRRTGQDSADDNNGGYSNRRSGRGRGGHPYSGGGGGGRSDHLDAAVRASVESAHLEEAVRESSAMSASSSDRPGSNNPQAGSERGISGESEAGFSGQGDGENEPSRYLAAVWGAGPSALGDAAFPPLPGTSKSSRRRAKSKNQGPASMAALLGGNGIGGGGRGGIRVLNTADHRHTSSSTQMRSVVEVDRTYTGQNSTSRREGLGTFVDTRIESSQAPSVSAVGGPGPPSVALRPATGGESSSSGNGVHTRGEWAVTRGPAGGASSVAGNGLPSRESAPVERSTMIKPLTAQVSELSLDLRAANKALVERIRTGLRGNEQQYADFKDVSARFRKGEMGSKEYYVHIARLGLSFIVPELARLCPDPQKGKELMEAHTTTITNNVVDPKSLPPGLAGAFPSLTSAREVERPAPKLAAMKSVVSDSAGSSGSSNGHTSKYIPEEAVEQLSSDGYRRAKGKNKIDMSSSTASTLSPYASTLPPFPALGTEGTLLNELAAARDRKPQVLVKAFPPLIQDPPQPQTSSATSDKPTASTPENGTWACVRCTLLNKASDLQCDACKTPQLVQIGKDAADAASASEKRKKKTSKFQRVRLGDGSAAALLDSTALNPWGQSSQSEIDSRNSGSSSGRGVWNNGGGQRLVSLVQREAIIDDAWSHGSK